MGSRLRALAGHLVFSLVVLGAPLFFATRYFYPGPLFFGDGGIEVIKLALAVDIVLGPCLTFCVYKKGKKGLLFDLTLIFTLQLAAFGYGFWTMVQQRPIAYVYDGQFFHTVTTGQIEGAVPSGLAGRLGRSPLPFFVVPQPVDAKQRQKLAQEVMANGRPYHVQARLWKDLDAVKALDLGPYAMRQEDVGRVKSESGRVVARKMLSGVDSAEYRVVILQMRYGNALALFNLKKIGLEKAELTDVGSLAIY